MRKWVLVLVGILGSCTDPYVQEAMRRSCPPELIPQVLEAINQCHAREVESPRYTGGQTDCFSLVSVTICPPIREVPLGR